MSSNRVVHFEIPASHPEALSHFYREMFGWNLQKVPVPGIDFWSCDGSSGPGMRVAVLQRQHEKHSPMNYVEVDSIDSAVEKATELGATVALPKMPVPGGSAIAAIIDPQGNAIGLLENPTSSSAT